MVLTEDAAVGEADIIQEPTVITDLMTQTPFVIVAEETDQAEITATKTEMEPQTVEDVANETASPTETIAPTAKTITWTQMTTEAAWEARSLFASVVLSDGTIVLMGGSSGGQIYFNDVWSSTDQGATWTLMTSNAGWTPRFGLTSVALPDDSIVMIGGSGQGWNNDVWRSEDRGATWAQMTANAGWTTRGKHTSVVLPDGSIVLMGGNDPFGNLNDVWRSTDMGATWNLMTPDTDSHWTPRVWPTSVALDDGSIVLMGGWGRQLENDVWHSTDMGATWTLLTEDAPWPAGADNNYSLALADGSIILISEIGIWGSEDQGSSWSLLTDNVPWAPRTGYTSVALTDGSIIILGGEYFGADVIQRIHFNDVWRLDP